MRLYGFTVTLSTDRDLVVLSAVQWRFSFVVQDSTDIWFCRFLCGFSTTTTTATSTATTTATAEGLFEVLRVHCLVILSTDRGLVVLRFCEGAEKVLSMED